MQISYAKNLSDRKERFFYRALEMLPGVLSWSTIIAVIALSYLKPFWVAVFIIFFVFYWLAKAIYFSFHLRAGYRMMKKNQRINWQEQLEKLSYKNYSLPLKDWKEIYHLVVLPMQKEPIEIVQESLNALLKSKYPKEKLIVVLALEERAGDHSLNIARLIKNEFQNNFFEFLITIHPQNIAQEIPAKSANETWAARKAKEIIDQRKIPYQNIIFSSFDIDTMIYPQYFGCLTYRYLTTKNPVRKSFQPIPLFLNNIWQAPAISRVFSFSTSFWHVTNQEREEKLITFSSHSMSFQALLDVGFKKTDVVSDDSRIFWQCFLKYDGDYKVVPLYYPLSMDANVGGNILKTAVSIYKQQKRWAYGAGDIAYFLFGFTKNKKIALRKKISLSWELIEGHWSWACSSILLFLLGWLPTTLGGHRFSQTLIGYNLPRIISKILTIAMIGIIASAYYAFYILPPKPKKRRFNALLIFLEWIFLPLTMFFFTSLPALDAQTRWLLGKYMPFWVTPKFRKISKIATQDGQSP